jgi:hypothetical protein
MAKIKKDNTIKQEQLATDIEIGRLNAQAKEYDKLLSLKKKGKAYDADRLKYLETEHRSTDSLLKKINKLVDKYNELGDSIKEANDDIDLTISNFDEMDSSLISIGNLVGKNSKLYTIQSERINKAKGVLASIAEVTKSNIDLSQKDVDAVKAYSVAYQSNMVSIAEANALKQRGEIDSERELELIKEATKSYKEATASIELSKEAVEATGEVLEKMNSEVNKYGVFAEKAASNTQSLDRIFDQFEGIPAMRELNTLIKTNIKDTLAFKAAMFAVGAAIGKAAFDYFGAPIKAAMQQQKEVEQIGIDGISERAKLQSDANFIDRDAAKGYSKIQEESDNNRIETARNVASAMNDANFAAERAANSFAASMKQGAVQFEAAAKTALFGQGIGSVSYGAAQMQLAGIGAEKVASAMSAAAGATGKMPTSKIASDMAILSERTGQSVESIADINEMFQRMDGASEKTALNLQEGLRTMAQQNSLDLGKLMSEVAEASKDALSYQIKGGKALAKQVGFAQSMGVNFGDVAKAGKSMVMNYKDSIKAEMQLSSLLGEQVDLSEVRAKFAEGDQAGALKALQAQGLNPEDMDMFQQEALSNALGGLDLNSLQKIAQNKGADVGNLKAGNVKGGNQQFLATTQQAQATLESKQAQISANEAIIDAKLSGKIADAFINSKGNVDYLKAQADQAGKTSLLNEEMDKLYKSSKAYNEYLTKSSQLDFVSGLKESLVSGLAPLIGGALMTGLTGGFKGVGGKIAGVFGKGKGASVTAASAVPTAMVAPVAAAGTGGGIASTLKDAAVSTITGGEGGIGSALKETAVGAVAGKADELIPGAGGIVEGLAGQVDAVEAPLEKAMTLGEKLKDLGKGLGQFGRGVGRGIELILKGIARGIAAFATPQAALGLGAVTLAFIGIGAALRLAAPAFEAIAPILIKIADVVGNVLIKALEVAGPIITSIFNGIGNVIKSIGTGIATVITSIGTSIAMLANVNAGNLGLVAASTTAMGIALAAFGVGSFVSGVGKFFGGSTFGDLKDISNYANPLMATAIAVDALANAFSRLGGINVSALNKIPWGDMEDFASEGGKFVIASGGGGGSLAVSKDTADNIKKMSTNTEAMVKLNNTMAKLLKEGFFGAETSRMSLYIDGKSVNTSLKRYKDNTKATNP